MAAFTSSYKGVAHGALNWDTQLKADMTSLETTLVNSTWTPSLGGGGGATVGSGGDVIGNTLAVGTGVIFSGRIAFGSGGTLGTGTVTLQGMNFNLITASAVGDGWYRKNSTGALTSLLLYATAPTTFVILIAGNPATAATGLTVSASDTIGFKIVGSTV